MSTEGLPAGLAGVMNRKIVLRQRPVGLVQPDDVELVSEPLPVPGPGEALVKVGWLGIDASVRTWLSKGEGYLPPVGIGEVVRCSGIGRVVASNSERLPVGTLAYSLPGWAEYAVLADDPMLTTPLPDDADPRSMISLYGSVGATAWMGIVDVANVEEGDTVVVSAAAGATGSIACQIAKNLGARVVGICGTDEKCRWLTEDLGLDAAINHRTADLPAALKEACPQRVDVYFDNVGGPILEAVLGRLARGARVALCGAISTYNATERPPGPATYTNLITARARMEGFLSIDIVPRYGEIAMELAAMVAAGKLQHREQVYEGLDAAPTALNAMFTGDNIGKILIRVDPDAT